MFKTHYALPGTAPATLATLVVPCEAEKPVIKLIEYDLDSVVEKVIATAADLPDVP